jgi:sarcosine oxidase subunit beta
MRVHTLIVGGGVMGTSIAMHVARRSDPLGEPVLLLERRELAAGSSGRSGAILRQHYAARELAGMARDSLREYAGFEARTGYSVGFRACGVLTLAGGGEAAARELVRGNVEMQRSIGIDTRLLEAPAIRALVRGIAVADDAVAAWEPGAGVCDPRRTVESFGAVARF